MHAVQQNHSNAFVSLTCETAHASSGFSKRSNENSINTLHAAATDSSWFLGTTKTEQNNLLTGGKTATNISITLGEWQFSVIFLIKCTEEQMTYTYFDHILWWCSVQRVPRMMSRKAHTVCHGEGYLIHWKWQEEYRIRYVEIWIQIKHVYGIFFLLKMFVWKNKHQKRKSPINLIPSTTLTNSQNTSFTKCADQKKQKTELKLTNIH